MTPVRLLLIEIGLWLAVMAAPLLFGAVYPWAAMGLASVLFLLLCLSPQSFFEFKHLPWNTFAGISLLFLWIIFQSFNASLNVHETREQLLLWLALAAGFALTMGIPRFLVPRLMFAVVLIGLMESVYALMQFHTQSETVLGISKTFHQGYVTGTYFNRNHLAGLLELCLGLHLGMWLHAFWSRENKKILGYGLLLPLPLYALLQTGSRMGLASFLLALLFGFFLLIGKKQRITVVFLLLFFLLAVASLSIGKDTILERIAELPQNLRTLEGRLVVWVNSMELLRHHFLTGVGLGNFQWAFPQYQSEALTWGWSHAHNDYLELAIELGIPAFILLLFSFLTLILWLLRSYRVSQHEDSAYVWGALVGVLAFSMHGLVDFNFAIPANAALYLFCVALGVRISLEHDFPAELQAAQPVGFHKTISNVVKTGIFLTAFFLAAICARKAWAGYWYYQGTRAADFKDFKPAVEAFQKAAAYEPNNAHVLYDAGVAAWKLGVHEKNQAWFKMSEQYFKKITEQMPFYGRAWLYLGLSKLYQYRGGSEDLIMQKQEGMDLISKAFDLEKGSAWISYMAGINLLMYSDLLDAEEQKLALFRIKKSLDMAPGRYLNPTLSFLWEKYGDWKLIHEVLPKNYASYQILIQFLKKKELWQLLAKVYPDYFELQNTEYEQYCREGLFFLKQPDYRQALTYYEKAYWMNQKRTRALAGMLIAQEGLEKLPQDYRQKVRTVLENEEEDLGEMAGLFRIVAELGRDSYLMGLYAYRTEDFSNAVKYFEIAQKENRIHKRFFAAAYLKTGQTDKAVGLLRPVLEESQPDVRDLLLLQEAAPKDRDTIEEKLKQIATATRPVQAWADTHGTKSELHGSGKTGMLLNLMPGKRFIEVNLKGVAENEKEYGILIFRLQDQVIGTAYAVYDEWYKILVSAETAGGRRWFEAELVNRPSEETSEGPWVYLGDVEIR